MDEVVRVGLIRNSLCLATILNNVTHELGEVQKRSCSYRRLEVFEQVAPPNVKQKFLDFQTLTYFYFSRFYMYQYAKSLSQLQG